MAITTSNPNTETDLNLEAGAPCRLYPSMTENLRLRWDFIRKVYTILSVQLLITAAISATVDLVHPVAHFLVGTKTGLGVFIAVVVLAVVVVVAWRICAKKHPVNYILMGLLTFHSLDGPHNWTGLCFLSREGAIGGLGLTVGVFISLTIFTLWAARRGYGFIFLCPFLFAALTVFHGFIMIQIFHPLGKASHMIFGIVGCIIVSGYIVFDTDKLIKRNQDDEFLVVAAALYIYAFTLFMSLITANIS